MKREIMDGEVKNEGDKVWRVTSNINGRFVPILTTLTDKNHFNVFASFLKCSSFCKEMNQPKNLKQTN